MTITFTVKDEAVKNSFEDILIPIRKSKPKWLSLLKPRDSVRSCPAFAWLFQDSLLVKLPCDLMVEKQGNDNRVVSLNPSLMEVYSHQLDYQLSEEHSSNFINLKFMPLVSFHSKKPVKAIQLSTFNYTPENEYLFRSVEGVFPFITKSTHLNINTFFRKEALERIVENMPDGENVLLPAGTPLCLLYFPNGLPKYRVEVGDINKGNVFFSYKKYKEGVFQIYNKAFKNDE